MDETKSHGSPDKTGSPHAAVPARDIPPDEQADLQDPDFQFALAEFLKAYSPVLEAEIKNAQDPAALAKAAVAQDPSCEDEFAQANQLLAGLFSDAVAVRLLPAAARELLGPAERWRPCLLHIRCCLIFGYLLCRRWHDFRVSNYYLYRFWRCVRETLGAPVGTNPSIAERADFALLVRALADAYKPYLNDQLASVEFPFGISDEVISGRLDCNEDGDGASAIIERLLTVETAPALLGAEVFAKLRQEPFFWFCRCWCLCAIRLGCCLARLRNQKDYVRCILAYRRCLRQCLRPLFCEITQPDGCVSDEVNVALKAYVLPIIGSAGGATFGHYVLEWSHDAITWHASDFIYPPIPPGNPLQGNAPVSGGLLAYLNTTALSPGGYHVRLTVFSVQGTTCVFEKAFALQKQEVSILQACGAGLDTTFTDPKARFVETVPAICNLRSVSIEEMSFGGCVQLFGAAFIGGCDERATRRYFLDYKPGIEFDCASGGWTNFWKIEFNTVWQKRSLNERHDTASLTAAWVSDCVVPVPFPPWCLDVEPEARLAPSCWQTSVPNTCLVSGLYTLRLLVEDTLGNTYCDLQRIWLDNKPICADIHIDAVKPCEDIFISKFAVPPQCNVAWSLPLMGTAYDELIDDTLPASRPNDNFDYYIISITRQGGPSMSVPITLSASGPCYQGVQRVGKCTPCAGSNVLTAGLLANFDLRVLDLVCGTPANLGYTVPAGLALKRGECCVYDFDLWVYDRSVVNCGTVHWAHAVWPVKICNDLP